MKIDATILVAEDEKPLRDALLDYLGTNGFETLSAEDGEQCVMIATKELPNLILLDIDMPTMDGFSVIEKLHMNEMTKQIPIVLLTNVDSTDMIAHAVDLGVSDYLVKAEMQLTDVVHDIKKKLGIKID